MLGILADALGLVFVGSIVTRQSMVEEWSRFLWLAIGLALGGLLLAKTGLPLVGVLAGYFALVTFGMRWILCNTWGISAIGAALFVVFKILYQVLMGFLFQPT